MATCDQRYKEKKRSFVTFLFILLYTTPRRHWGKFLGKQGEIIQEMVKQDILIIKSHVIF